MRSESTQQFPHPSIRRLPSYLGLLRRLENEGVRKISCPRIARELDLDSTQVRKDLALTGVTGRPRIGFEVTPLVQAIETFLGWNSFTDAFLVGSGSLGQALIGYEYFRACGMNIVAAFDVDKRKIGRTIHGKKIYTLSAMPAMARNMQVILGILTVPAAAAQAATDGMVDSGIRAIWNFAPTRLDVPGFVMVENVELASSLAVLSVTMNDWNRSAPRQKPREGFARARPGGDAVLGRIMAADG